jgi:uncharacterized protein YndB with AHSA1/START domain
MKTEVDISGNRLRLTRFFEAPRPMVFGWWSSAEKLQQWSGCKEATRCVVEMDFRPGGSFTQKMEIGGKGEFTHRGQYDEIVPPERIVYRANFGPVMARVVVEFSEQGAGTRVVVTHEGPLNEMFFQTVSQGASESLEKLATLIAGGL